MITDEENREALEELLLTCESPKIRLLWEIFFEIDVRDIDVLERHIYEYGSMVKEHDYAGRELFVGMVSLLSQLKKRNSQKHIMQMEDSIAL